MRFNGISTTTYANRRSDNGGGDSTQTSQNKITINAAAGSTLARFTNGYIANFDTKEKLALFWTITQQTAGAGTAPNRIEAIGKHAQTTNPIDQMTIVNTGGNFPTGAELVVLGWDPADTHTNNFWEELAVDTGDGSSTDITCTFTAKKYLWIQAYIEGSVGAVQTFRLGSSSTPDTGSNYAQRVNFNGGTDSTDLTKTDLLGGVFNDGVFPALWNFFIVNVAANEKLVIAHRINQNGTGAGTAAARSEHVMKWTNTSNQADIFEINRASGNWTTSSIVKVWGSN